MSLGIVLAADKFGFSVGTEELFLFGSGKRLGCSDELSMRGGYIAGAPRIFDLLRKGFFVVLLLLLEELLMAPDDDDDDKFLAVVEVVVEGPRVGGLLLIDV